MKFKAIAIASATATALTLGGCAAQQLAWYKPSATNQEFFRTKVECTQVASTIPVGTAVLPVGNMLMAVPMNGQRAATFNDCMQGEGWSLISKQQ